METRSSDGTPVTSPATVVAALQAAGVDASMRRLESWRADRLVPALHRGRLPGDPPWGWTDDDIRAVEDACRVRPTTLNLDTLRIRLWLRGHPQSAADVRASLVRIVNGIMRDGDRELARHRVPGGNDEAAVRALAAELARRRGRSPLPRGPGFSRQSLAARELGIAFLLRVFALGEADSDPVAAAAAERVLGLDRGRRSPGQGLPVWLTGSPTDLAAAADITGLPALHRAAAAATGAELEAARPPAATLASLLPIFARFLGAYLNDPNPVGWGGLRMALADPDAAVLVVPLAVSLARANPDGLREVTVALAQFEHQLTTSLRTLHALGPDELARRLGFVPPADAARIRRVHAEFTRT